MLLVKQDIKMKWIRQFITWFKYKNHPCYVSNNEFDHDYEYIDDSYGDGIYQNSCGHVECINCGNVSNDEADMPSYDDFEPDCWFDEIP